MTATAKIAAFAPLAKNPPKAARKLKAFGKAIRQLRKQKGISRPALAKQIELSYSNLANIETGQNWPAMPVYIRICAALGVGVPPLVG